MNQLVFIENDFAQNNIIINETIIKIYTQTDKMRIYTYIYKMCSKYYMLRNYTTYKKFYD